MLTKAQPTHKIAQQFELLILNDTQIDLLLYHKSQESQLAIFIFVFLVSQIQCFSLFRCLL